MTYARNGAVSTLLEMLTAKRPAGSKSERRFIRDHIEPLGITRDAVGNLIKRIGDAPVMWSCHTDTVHRAGGSQMVTVEDGFAVLPKGSGSNCLGADDTAGVWIMCEMIRAQRPGLYVFHRAEEIGGVGSEHISQRNPGLLAGIGCAIALDRRGTGDVITHQATGRCCSDAFAAALVKSLGGSYAPSSQGIFTDTANYVDLVGECTNLSVGYMNEHRAHENLDIPFVVSLRDTLVNLDTRDLPIVRKPGEDDAYDYCETGSHWSRWDDYNSIYDQRRVVDIVREYPHEVADILEAYGIDAKTLLEEIKDRTLF